MQITARLANLLDAETRKELARLAWPRPLTDVDLDDIMRTLSPTERHALKDKVRATLDAYGSWLVARLAASFRQIGVEISSAEMDAYADVVHAVGLDEPERTRGLIYASTKMRLVYGGRALFTWEGSSASIYLPGLGSVELTPDTVTLHPARVLPLAASV